MKKYNYHINLSDNIIEELQAMIGAELIQVHAVNGKQYFSSINDESVLSMTFNTDAYLTFRNSENEYFKWKIYTQPLGDSWVGYDMYGLNIELKQSKSSVKEWLKSDRAELDTSALTLNIKEKIESIDIYGIDKAIERIENDKIAAYVNAKLDLLLVYNTSGKNKLAITGDSRSQGITLTRYPKNAIHEFEEWVENRENQWNERIFNFKRRIQ